MNSKYLFLALVLSATVFLVKADDDVEDDDTDSETETVKELKIEVLEKPEECEEKSVKGNLLSMHYKGTLEDGTQFDSSYDREPFKFQVGVGQVVQGWDQGLLDMCVGEKRRLTIPPHLGYGDKGAGAAIPPGATLFFDTELLAIEQAPPPVNIFKEIDGDGDRQLSRDEISDYLKKRMGALNDEIAKANADDGDDEEDEQKKKIREQHEKMLEEIFKHEDADKDGFISHEEFRGPKHDEL